MGIKRNCTAVLEITVRFKLADIQRLEFVFKSQPDSTAPELLRLKYEKEKIPVKPGEQTEDSTVLSIKLSPEETFKFTKGTVFMDTKIVKINGDVPETELVVIEDIEETLFGEVHKNA